MLEEYSKTRFFWHDYRYFPYERRLAKREAEAITGFPVQETEEGLVGASRPEQLRRLAQLTYFRGVQAGNSLVIPNQARLEATSNGKGQAWIPGIDVMPRLTRQSTRYSAHGLHEYRGKFNPQVVRAVGNLLHLDEGDWLLDPFCGSGTTLLEAAHVGWNAVGFDVNPLGVLIANAKIAAFRADPVLLRKEATDLISRLTCGRPQDGEHWRGELPNAQYLAAWFSTSVLGQLAIILREVDAVKKPELRDVFRVALSDICRDVSLQDPGDLRIRRRKDLETNYDAVAAFTGSLLPKVEAILAARQQVSPKRYRQFARLGNCQDVGIMARCLASEGGRCTVDAAITSPPYATALPYIDTQRLSLCLLGLVQSEQIRPLERTLIGNREVSEAQRRTLENDLLRHGGGLPSDVREFCKRLLNAAAHEGHGFRKRNVPALVYGYFCQMGRMFESVRRLVRRGGRYALLVGCNRTNLQGEDIEIDTPNFLASVAESRGWRVEESLVFETYQRYDVHQKNSIRSEVLLVLRNTDNPHSEA